MSKGDKMYRIVPYYPKADESFLILDNFSYEHETKEYNYTKEEILSFRANPVTFVPDNNRLVSQRKKYNIQDIKQSQKGMSLISYDFIINKKIYSFQGHDDPKTVMKKIAADIATRYVQDKEYKKYVDSRLAKIADYDFMGRKKSLEHDSVNGWKIVEYLSTGYFGATYIVSKNGINYVMKTFHTKAGKRSPKAVEKECQISRLAGEIGVGPKVLDCSSTSDPQYIVMEKLEGPTMKEKYGVYQKVPITEISRLEKRIEILDQNHIKHNDIHIGNVMYHKGKIYIIDYGQANIVKAFSRNNIKK